MTIEAAILRLRERANGYGRDAEILTHDDAGTPADVAILTTIRDELRKVANEMEAAS